jgi:glycosyltransferase A (GT-A) superfamily protein (DUF2064 family)
MARVPGQGPVKTRLHGALSAARATELYRCFLLDRLDALAAVPEVVRRLLVQEGDALEDRLTRLFGRLLDEGHAGAIAIDSDSPTLPMAYVAEAARVLAAGTVDVVVGPSDDGGYYLVGVRSPQPTLFDGVPWSTPDTRRATLEGARRLGLTVHLLPPWFDVDTADDLARLRAELAGRAAPPRTAQFVRTLA